ncbi:MAG: nicotinate-nucleotide adenylyltransferase [Microthrixaceae bacterium]
MGTEPHREGSPSGPARLGVLGGTFDPPHIGHLVMATTVREELGLDSVLLMVAGDPWQKSSTGDVSPAEDRLAMTEAAARGVEGLVVSDLEVRREGPTYTVETLEELHRQHPTTEIFWILGADAIADIHTWHRHREIGGLCQLVVVDRPGAPLAVPEGLEVTFVEAPRLEVSSTELRRRVERGRSLDFLVPSGAISEIRRRGLYAGAR